MHLEELHASVKKYLCTHVCEPLPVPAGTKSTTTNKVSRVEDWQEQAKTKPPLTAPHPRRLCTISMMVYVVIRGPPSRQSSIVWRVPLPKPLAQPQ